MGLNFASHFATIIVVKKDKLCKGKQKISLCHDDHMTINICYCHDNHGVNTSYCHDNHCVNKYKNVLS